MGAQAEVELNTGARLRSDTQAAVIGDLPVGWDAPRTGSVSLVVPDGWVLDRVARSHGWSGLAPCAYDGTALHRTLLLCCGPVTVRVDADGTVSWGSPLAVDAAKVVSQTSRLLALDDDLTGFVTAVEGHPEFGWMATWGGGSLLRSPTVWEDLARTLTTTNCSWALTKQMCRRFTDILGSVGPLGEKAFPTAAQVVGAGEPVLTGEIRVGYRARAFVELAQRCASGELAEQGWLAGSGLTDAEVLQRVRGLRGFGPYAAEGMLGLLGRHRGLSLDSWVRVRVPAVVGVEAMTDAEIAARYAPFGEWAGTVLWLDITRHWFIA